jgi:hypothetical protein
MDAFLSNPKNLIIVGVLIVALYYVFTKFLGKKKPEEPKKAFKDTLRYCASPRNFFSDIAKQILVICVTLCATTFIFPIFVGRQDTFFFSLFCCRRTDVGCAKSSRSG